MSVCAEGPRRGRDGSLPPPESSPACGSRAGSFVFEANIVVLTLKVNKGALVSAAEQGVCLHLADGVQGAWRAGYWKPPEITALALAPFSDGARHARCLCFLLFP